MFAWDTAEDEEERGGGWSAAACLLAALALVAWAGLYAAGALPWLGYGWLKRDWESSGKIFPSVETTVGSTFGLSTFLFFEGQEIAVAYDADIRAGSLRFHVYEPFDGTLGDGVAHYLTESGAGVWTVPIRTTGFHTIIVEPTTVRSHDRGWDLTYRVWWGARPGG